MWQNGFVKWLLRSPLHGFISGNIVLVQYHGRLSNKPYAVPVSYIRFYDEEGEERSYIAIVSFRQRTWWRNLRQGRAFTIRLRGRDLPATAEIIEDEQAVLAALPDFLQAAPEYAGYMYISKDEEGQFKADELQAAAAKRVIIYVHFSPDDSGWTTTDVENNG